MAIERIDSMFDTAALQKEVDVVRAGLSSSQKSLVELYELIGKLKGSGFADLAVNVKKTEEVLKGVEAQQEKVKRGVDELTLAAREYKKTADSTAVTQAKINVATSEASKQNAAAKATLQELNTATKEEIQLAKAAEGSIKQKQIQIKILQRSYDELSATERNSGRGQQLLSQIQQLDKELKQLEGTTGRFQRNVGNYKSAFSEAFGTLKSDLDEIKEKLDDPAIGGEHLEELKERGELIAEVLEELSIKFTSSTSEARAFQQAAQKIGLEFGQQSKQFQAFKEKVGEGIDELHDLKESIKLSASDTAGLDRLISAASALTGAYSIAKGASVLFGAENEEIQKQFVKLQAALTVLNGLQAVQNELKNKDSIFRKAANYLLGLELKLTKAQAIAQTENAAATQTATKATKAWGTALKASGIGLLLTLLPLLVSAMDGLASSFKENEEKSNRLNEINKKSVEIYGDQVAELKVYQAQIKDSNASNEEKKRILEEVNEKYGDQIGRFKDINDLEQNFITRTDKFIEVLKLRGKAQAAQQLATEEYKKALEAQNTTIDENIGFWEGTINAIKSGGEINSVISANIKTGIENQTKSIKEANKSGDAYSSMFDNLMKQADDLAKTNGFKILSEDEKKRAADALRINTESARAETQTILDKNNRILADEKTSFAERIRLLKDNASQQKKLSLIDLNSTLLDPNKSNADKVIAQKKYNYEITKINADANATIEKESKSHSNTILQQSFELNKQKLEQDIKFNQEIIDSDKSSADQKVAAAQRSSDLQKQLAEEEYNNQKRILSQKASSDEEYQLLEANKDAKLVEIAAATQKDIFNIIKAANDKLQDESKNTQQKFIEFLQSNTSADVDNTQQYSKDVQALNKALQEKKISVEEYNKQRLKLDNDYSEASLQTQIEKLQNVIDYKKSHNEDVKNDEIALADLQKQLSDDVTKHDLANQEKRRQKLLETLSNIQEVGSKILESIAVLNDISYEKQKAQIEETEAGQQKVYEQEVENITNSSLSEQQKADKLKILESQRMAQKEANERKQKQLDIQRARFEKAQTIASIITETALAVIRALGAKPYTPANIALAIATGALGAAQLAKAIATPLPKFSGGTQSAPEGWAITDEIGAEMYREPSGKTFMGSDDGPTLRYLKSGTKIIPHNEVNELMHLSMMRMTADKLRAANGYKPDNAMEKKLDKLDDTMKWVGVVFQKSLSKQKAPRVIIQSRGAYNDYVKKNIYN